MIFKLHYEPNTSMSITADVLVKVKELKALATCINYKDVTLFKCGIVARMLLNVMRAYIYAKYAWWHFTCTNEQDEDATEAQKMFERYETRKVIIKNILPPEIAKFY